MNTHIWRYKEGSRNFPGYHLTADAQGCAALLEWLRNPTEQTKFRLQPVTSEVLRVPNNKGGLAASVSCTSFQLLVRPDVEQGYLAFTEVAGGLSLECSSGQMKSIIEGVEDIARGHGDYCIGDDDQPLWFWWYPDLG